MMPAKPAIIAQLVSASNPNPRNWRSAIASAPVELALPGHRVRPPLGEDAKRLRGNTLPAVSLSKAASTVSLLTLASRVTGLVRDLLMATLFGANALTDAFNVAFRIPNLFRRLFAEGAFSQAFVPVLATTKAQQGEEATRQLIAAVATMLAWVLLLTCILGVVGAPVLVWALASGLRQSGEAYDAAVLMTRWMFPYIGFMSMVALSAGILNTWKHFAVPAASPVLLNLCMIAAAWLGAPQLQARGIEPIFAMAGGVMLGGVLQLAVQVPALARLGLVPRIGVTWGAIRAAWAEPGVRRVLTLMGPILLGAGGMVTVRATLEAYLPAGTSLQVHAKADAPGAAWVEVPYLSSSAMTAGVMELTYELQDFAAERLRLRVTVHGGFNARPWATNLRAVVL